MLPLRLVVDANVVVSGALKPQGLERTAWTLALTAPARLFVSRQILDEYSEVLARPELRVRLSERKDLLDLIAERSRIVAPKFTLAACHDPDDNIFLECAQAAAADYLITGNKRHFPSHWLGTKIINAREFLEIIAPHLPAH